jgi:cellulose biosynthesis protein BcsE
MNDSLTAGPVLHARLGISKLPLRLSIMARGMVYAVAVDQQSVRIPLITRTVLQSLEAGLPCVLMSPFDPASLLKKGSLAGVDLSAFLRTGQLKIFRQKQTTSKDLFKTGVGRLIDELGFFNLPQRSLVVFDNADSSFCLADPTAAVDAANLYSQWAEAHEHTILAAFVPSANSPRDYVTLRSVSENFGGFAIVKAVDDETVLDVRHWFGAQGAVPRSSYALQFADNGQIEARPTVAAGRMSVDPSREINIVSRKAAQDFGAASANWRIAENYMDVIDLMRNSPGGTAVLHFDRAQNLKELAQAVAALRALARPQMRVVIRECGARLRLAQTVALLRLGVSMVIPAEVGGSSGRMMADSLKGSTFARSFESDVNVVLEDARSEPNKGPLSVTEFRRRVETLLNISADFEIPHTLISFSTVTPQAAKAAASALRRSARDAVFCDVDASLEIFLFGCPPENAEMVLSRILGARFESLLLGWQRISGNTEILSALSRIEPEPESIVAQGNEVGGNGQVIPFRINGATGTTPGSA